MENKLAKALYDNTAECPDELAFRKGDILRVVDRSAVGTSGWWLCSLHGRQGVAPANRLQLLPPPAPAPGTGAPEWPGPPQAEDHARPQNIYQVPSVPRPSSSPLYERMDKIYKAPSSAPRGPGSPALRGPGSPALRHGWESTEASRLTASGLSSSPDGGVYDVPSRRPSLNPTQMSQRKTCRKAWLTSPAGQSPRCSSPNDTYVYAVPPAHCREPCYDVPVPSATDALQRTLSSCNTLPSRRKGDWIYDVPVSPEKPGLSAASGGTLPSRAPGRQLFPPPSAAPAPLGPPGPGLYAVVNAGPPPERPPTGADLPALPPRVRASVYGQPPARRSSEEQVYAVPPQDKVCHIPLECRGDASYPYDHTRARLQRMRTVLGPASLRQRPGGDDPLLEDEEGRSDSRRAATDSQRISTASSSSTSSTSSTSSCDSTAPSSSSCSPEPLREVGLSQEEAGARLLELHEALGRAVHRLMDFVSSSWRSREHLEKHLEEIRAAAEGIDRAVSGFLAFALDVKGNARHLTDANLRTRLLKQLSIVEDSGLILRQTVGSLSASGWPLDALSQDPGLLNTPDQLERFVMVARTVPEDVKRLVSILNANGRLLFRPNQREPGDGGPGDGGPGDGGPAAAAGGQQNGDAVDDDNDYVQLQTKKEFERQNHRREADPHDGTPSAATGHEETTPPGAPPPTQEGAPAGPRPEHCRLYFGALQKALGGFVGSLRGGQPPEQFIPHSKLVIMVGQRLVNTLYQDARGAGARQSLLCKSSHLCALLKQLAVATKKAALHFPDKQALQEAHDFAGELAQKAQHFRISLDL
ncbi:cas scaffolding protein family member 4 [Gadus morhua]|nr:cas scaffolding protein family member 4 [Gadus morhua]